MSECKNHEKIPEKFHSCFWDTEFDNLDEKDMAYYRMTESGGKELWDY